MSLERSAQIDDAAAGGAWQEIESALEELSGLARSEVDAAEFHSRMLARLVGVLGAVGGLVWIHETGEALQIESQMNLGESLGGDSTELARHRRLAEGVAAGGQARVVPAAYRDGEVANASPCLAILCPIVVEQQAVAVVEIFQRPESRSSAVEGYLRLVRTACEIAEEFHQARALNTSRQRERELAELVEYLERIQRPLGVRGVAGAIANESRRLLGCDRVSVLTQRGARPTVAAISGVESFDRRSAIVQALETLVRSVVSAGQPLWLPEQGDDLPPNVIEQVQALLDESHAKGLGLIPIQAGAQEAETTVGMLAVERFGASFGPKEQRQAMYVAKASSASLANAIAYDQIPLRGVLQWLAAVLGIAPGQQWSPAAVGSIALVVAAAALGLIPAEFTVEARGEAMPQQRQHVFAPSAGVVVALSCVDGERVKKGQLLAKLHSPQIEIDESELMGKARTVQEELLAAETAALRSELEQSGPMRGQHSARVLQLQEELRGLESQLQIVRRQQAALEVKSPLDGMVVTWDVQRQLAGRPVKQGDSLLTVADTEGAWELLVEIPDRAVGHVLAARKTQEQLPVSFQLGTQPGHVGKGVVAFVSPATEVSGDARPAVRATVEFKVAPEARFRPGATVVTRIHCGRRSLGFVWLHELWEAIRLRLFL